MRPERLIAPIVVGFSAAPAIARATDRIAAVAERYASTLREEMVRVQLPVVLTGGDDIDAVASADEWWCGASLVARRDAEHLCG